MKDYLEQLKQEQKRLDRMMRKAEEKKLGYLVLDMRNRKSDLENEIWD